MPLGDDSHRSRGAQGLPRTHTRGFDEERTRVLGLVFGILGAQRINGLESCHLWDQRDHTNDLAGSPSCECPSSKAPPVRAPLFFFSAFWFAPFFSQNQYDGGAAKSLGRRPASTAASCGVRRHTPLGPSPVSGATPRQPRNRAPGAKRTGRATIVPSTASLDAKAAGVTSFVPSIRLSHFRRT